jgi:flavodoxin
MSKTLVVYFSRTGYTRRLAEEIAAGCGGDVESIDDVRSRSGILGYWRSAREALKRKPAEIRPGTKDPAAYELVILGTPVWAGHVSSPMRAYLAATRGKLGRVAFFVTEGGSGAERVFREMGELCGLAPVASEVFTDREIDQRGYADKLDRLLATQRSAAAA